MSTRPENKAQRILEIERLLWAHPEGLTRAEIARRLGVNRSTITKYLNKDSLPPSIYEDDFDGNKLKIDRSADLTRAAFNLNEVFALHMATRLLADRTDKHNPHAASALRKLAVALQRLDRNVSTHMLLSADVMDEASASRDPIYLSVLETLTAGWSTGRKVRVLHQSLAQPRIGSGDDDGPVYEYLISPYLIEPYAVGQTAHVIGLREPPGRLRTLKIERIRRAELTHDHYAIPEDFDPRIFLRDAWGIWTADGEPVEVVLRFHPRVARRVCETRWHGSQELERGDDGYVTWRGRIAEPREMLPWVRGWGSDCEVLAPESLREQLMGEARAMAEQYGWTVTLRAKDEGSSTLDDFFGG